MSRYVPWEWTGEERAFQKKGIVLAKAVRGSSIVNKSV